MPEFEEDLVKTSDGIYALTPHLRKSRIIAFRTPGGVPWQISKQETRAVLGKYQMVDRPWLDGPPLTMKTLPPVLATVDTALAGGGTGFMDFHGVGGDPNSCPTEFFTALLDKLDQHREEFWITDTVSWFQYQEERKNSDLKVLQSDATQVRVSLTCSSVPVLYDLPLTVAVEVPTSWKKCSITQATKPGSRRHPMVKFMLKSRLVRTKSSSNLIRPKRKYSSLPQGGLSTSR